MAGAVVDAIQTIYQDDSQPLDLHRVEILSQERQTAEHSRFVKGLVLDHGARHPDMPAELHIVHIMTCNVLLEYEQAETQTGSVYSTAEEREKLVESERVWLDERCRKIVELNAQSAKKVKSFALSIKKVSIRCHSLCLPRKVFSVSDVPNVVTWSD
jgi:T-complex protein 1 subunit zeta